jgi:hypothetical protein
MGIYTDYNKIRGLRILDKDTDKLLYETITEDNCYLNKKDIDSIIASIKQNLYICVYVEVSCTYEVATTLFMWMPV